MKNLVIETSYETIKKALFDWGLCDNDEKESFPDYIYGVIEVTDALLEKIDKVKASEE